MASLPDPPPGLDLTETNVPRFVASTCLTWAMGFVCVGLRFFARKLTRGGFWWDDWIILTSLIWSSLFIFVATCYMVPRGLGLHIWAGPPDAMRSYLLGLYITAYAYTLSLFTTKAAILAFYWRIFSIDRRIRLPLIILFAFLFVWTVILLLVIVLQCQPISAFWSRFDPINPIDTSKYHCGVNVHQFFVANSTINIITDVLLMAVPLPFIWNLSLLRSQKIAVTGVFVVGLFVTIVSGVRFYYTMKLDFTNPDVIWLASQEMNWTIIEVNVAIVCGTAASFSYLIATGMHNITKNGLSMPPFDETNYAPRSGRPDSQHAVSEQPSASWLIRQSKWYCQFTQTIEQYSPSQPLREMAVQFVRQHVDERRKRYAATRDSDETRVRCISRHRNDDGGSDTFESGRGSAERF